jgi:ankyrin repeat protein
MRLYLECGADPNAADYDMRTCLHIACAEGLIPMVKLLVSMGGDLNLKCVAFECYVS